MRLTRSSFNCICRNPGQLVKDSSNYGGAWVQDIYSRGVVETRAKAPPALEKIARHFESKVLGSADGIAVIHPRFKNYLKSSLGINEQAVTTIRNWTHIRSGPLQPPDQTRTQLGWLPEEKIVLHAGNMGAKQSLENVIAAARIAERNNSPMKFVLLGDGNQRKRLEAISTNCKTLQFHRPMDDYNFRSAISAADILLVNEKPGLSETALPSKLTTYFAAGKPIIAATDNTSITAEEVLASRGGIQVPAGEPASLVDAVNRLSQSADYATSLGKFGFRYYSENLTETVAIDNFERWLYRLIEGQR